MLTEDQVAALNDQACTNNLGRQGEWDELNEDGKAWVIELARLAYERGRAETATASDEQDHQAWLVLMMTQPEKAALAAHHLRTQLTQAQAEIAALRKVVEAADKMRKELLAWTTEAEEVPAFDTARAKLKETTGG